MKIIPIPLAAFVLLFCPSLASAGLVLHQSVNTEIPDFDPNGLVSVINVNTGGKLVQSVEVNLVTSGGWNGDLYAYLQHSSGATSALSVLLNRPGRTDDNEAGSASSGMNVVFRDDAASDLNTSISQEFGEFVTGTYQPDARAVDPSLVTDLSPRTLFLSGFAGMLADGDWTLFIADLAAGDVATLTSWTLTLVTGDSPIAAIPEPSEFLLGAVPAMLAGLFLLRRRVEREGRGGESAVRRQSRLVFISRTPDFR
jgi:subtilisin-like proprotein convertase family protein